MAEFTDKSITALMTELMQNKITRTEPCPKDLTDEEAALDQVSEEASAAMKYKVAARHAEDPHTKAVFESNADEELVHIGEDEEVAAKQNKRVRKKINEGVKEAEEIGESIKRARKPRVGKERADRRQAKRDAADAENVKHYSDKGKYLDARLQDEILRLIREAVYGGRTKPFEYMWSLNKGIREKDRAANLRGESSHDMLPLQSKEYKRIEALANGEDLGDQSYGGATYDEEGTTDDGGDIADIDSDPIMDPNAERPVKGYDLRPIQDGAIAIEGNMKDDIFDAINVYYTSLEGGADEDEAYEALTKALMEISQEYLGGGYGRVSPNIPIDENVDMGEYVRDRLPWDLNNYGEVEAILGDDAIADEKRKKKVDEFKQKRKTPEYMYNMEYYNPNKRLLEAFYDVISRAQEYDRGDDAFGLTELSRRPAIDGAVDDEENPIMEDYYEKTALGRKLNQSKQNARKYIDKMDSTKFAADAYDQMVAAIEEAKAKGIEPVMPDFLRLGDFEDARKKAIKGFSDDLDTQNYLALKEDARVKTLGKRGEVVNRLSELAEKEELTPQEEKEVENLNKELSTLDKYRRADEQLSEKIKSYQLADLANHKMWADVGGVDEDMLRALTGAWEKMASGNKKYFDRNHAASSIMKDAFVPRVRKYLDDNAYDLLTYLVHREMPEVLEKIRIYDYHPGESVVESIIEAEMSKPKVIEHLAKIKDPMERKKEAMGLKGEITDTIVEKIFVPMIENIKKSDRYKKDDDFRTIVNGLGRIILSGNIGEKDQSADSSKEINLWNNPAYEKLVSEYYADAEGDDLKVLERNPEDYRDEALHNLTLEAANKDSATDWKTIQEDEKVNSKESFHDRAEKWKQGLYDRIANAIMANESSFRGNTKDVSTGDEPFTANTSMSGLEYIPKTSPYYNFRNKGILSKGLAEEYEKFTPMTEWDEKRLKVLENKEYPTEEEISELEGLTQKAAEQAEFYKTYGNGTEIAPRQHLEAERAKRYGRSKDYMRDMFHMDENGKIPEGMDALNPNFFTKENLGDIFYEYSEKDDEGNEIGNKDKGIIDKIKSNKIKDALLRWDNATKAYNKGLKDNNYLISEFERLENTLKGSHDNILAADMEEWLKGFVSDAKYDERYDGGMGKANANIMSAFGKYGQNINDIDKIYNILFPDLSTADSEKLFTAEPSEGSDFRPNLKKEYLIPQLDASKHFLDDWAVLNTHEVHPERYLSGNDKTMFEELAKKVGEGDAEKILSGNDLDTYKSLKERSDIEKADRSNRFLDSAINRWYAPNEEGVLTKQFKGDTLVPEDFREDLEVMPKMRGFTPMSAAAKKDLDEYQKQIDAENGRRAPLQILGDADNRRYESLVKKSKVEEDFLKSDPRFMQVWNRWGKRDAPEEEGAEEVARSISDMIADKVRERYPRY